MENLEQTLRTIVSETIGNSDLPEGDAFSSSNLTLDFGLDSLDVINVLFQIEEELGVKIPEDDIEEHSLLVVSNLLAYLNKHG